MHPAASCSPLSGSPACCLPPATPDTLQPAELQTAALNPGPCTGRLLSAVSPPAAGRRTLSAADWRPPTPCSTQADTYGQWWNVVKYIYSSTVSKCSSGVGYFILLLHKIFRK